MEVLNLNDEFSAIVRHHLNIPDAILVDAYDWSRANLSNLSVTNLNDCAKSMQQFLLKFTGANQPELSDKAINLLLAIELETRRRPLPEQYPEWAEPLRRVNERLDRISNENEQVSGWQKHFDDHLELIFTNVAFDFLRHLNPANVYVNLLSDTSITKKWNFPPKYDFEVDGLIYDETDNILYMVESKYNLTHKELSKAEKTWEKLDDYIKHSERMPITDSVARRFNRIWLDFFGEVGTITGSRETIRIEAFLGFHSAESEKVVNDADAKGFRLIGPHGQYYHVLERVTAV